MREYTNKTALSFDDIMLVPQYSDIEHRSDISLHTTIGVYHPISLITPIISAPMDTVSESEMCVALEEVYAYGSIHRYMSIEEQLYIADKLLSQHYSPFFAIGATGEYIKHAIALMSKGVNKFIIDTANGHSKIAIEAVQELRQFPIHIMAGNVSTWEGFKRLSDAGADSIRVGIGGGAACTTRTVTGHGIPTLASIMDIASRRGKKDASIIADGGIRNSGDMVKAFAAGADAVMLGSLLAGHAECPVASTNGFMEFRGMASEEAQKHRGRLSVVEGLSTKVKYKGSVKDTLTTLRNGLLSGCSYAGVSRLEDLKDEALFIRVSTLSNKETRKKV
jgi:IMP dehydrogenase